MPAGRRLPQVALQPEIAFDVLADLRRRIARPGTGGDDDIEVDVFVVDPHDGCAHQPEPDWPSQSLNSVTDLTGPWKV